MRVLVIGAGALGGYFGACLHRAGRDVTFLVRPARAEQLSRDGLRIVSPHGDFAVAARTVLAGELHEPYDLVLLGVKSYGLDAAMEEFAPAVGRAPAILPVLNGMAHLDRLRARFGAGPVLGGTAIIVAALESEGRIVLSIPNHDLTFGELAGGSSDRIRGWADFFEGAGFKARASDMILQDMWEKWAALAATAGITCLMRASIGDILAAPGGRDALLSAFGEGRAVATASGFAPRPAFVEFATSVLTRAGSPVKASMLRDIERGATTEGEHILGDMAIRARGLGIATPILDLARIHLAAYEATRRER